MTAISGPKAVMMTVGPIATDSQTRSQKRSAAGTATINLRNGSIIATEYSESDKYGGEGEYMSFARRVLFNGDDVLEITISVPTSCSKGEYWRSAVELKSRELSVSQFIGGSDAIDALLNAMVFIHNYLEQQCVKWVRFPSEGDDWHWFPVIGPSFGREFDNHLEVVIEREGGEYCRKNDRQRVNSRRIDPQS